MKASLVIPTLAASAVIAAAVVFVQSDSTSQPTPTHVTAQFFDGVNTGNFVETCRVWRAAVGHLRDCTAYLVQRAAFFGLGSYRIVGHSYVGWREHGVSVARVTVTNGSAVIHARLVKTRLHGWLVVTVH